MTKIKVSYPIEYTSERIFIIKISISTIINADSSSYLLLSHKSMPTESDPEVFNWYQHLDKGQKFRVIAMDDSNALVEIQYFDGDLDEIDLDVWKDLDIEPIETPEYWTGPMDITEQDDFGGSITDTSLEDWSSPLQEIKDTEDNDVSDEYFEPTDEWGERYAQEERLESDI
jgi:Family of unknown function (DUF6763)